MITINQVAITGNLANDAEIRYTPSSFPIMNVAIAHNNRKKGSDGNWEDDPCFIDVTMLGETAEKICPNLKRGDRVLVQGRLQMERWEAKDGTSRRKVKILASRIVLEKKTAGTPRQEAAPKTNQYVPPPSEDDIPF